VNYGKGDGLAIKALSIQIKNDIKEKFGISLYPEVNFI
jgi:UDP-N-acetylenolpyruvoylglucosamine reductase